MARAYGSSAHLLMKRETAYGQAATGNYIRVPFNRCNLGSEQGLIDDPVLGQGRDLAERTFGVHPCLVDDLNALRERRIIQPWRARGFRPGWASTGR